MMLPIEAPELMHAVALRYLAAGLSVLPIPPGTKFPNIPWKPYQRHRPTLHDVAKWFPAGAPRGICIITGEISGAVLPDGTICGLEILDIDDVEIATGFLEAARWHGLDTLLERLPREMSPRGGLHLGWRCNTWEGNQVLAERLSIETGHPKTLIETRGEGGLCVVAPTPPSIHPEYPDRGYTLFTGDWTHIPIISASERQALFEFSRSYNEYAPELVDAPPKPPGANGAVRPGDLLNTAADDAWWDTLLAGHGWVKAFVHRGISHWRRPGKSEGSSATLGACGPYFYVFSSNAAPFQAGKAYKPFGAYTLLEHGGDYAAAAKVLAKFYDLPPRAAHGDTESTAFETPFGDLYNAKQLLKEYGAHMRHCAPWKSWLLWNGTYWIKDETGQAQQWAISSLETLGKQAIAAHDKSLTAYVSRQFMQSKFSSMLAVAQSMPGIGVLPDIFDLDPWLLNCVNGTLNLRTMLLEPPRQDDHLTKCVPVRYLPDATCPTWERFLWKIMGGSTPGAIDEADMGAGELEERSLQDARAHRLVQFLQRAIGYTLTGSTQEQCLFFLYGNGSNGKSTFLETLQELLKTYACSTPSDTLMSKERGNDGISNDIARLRGTRFVSSVEIGENRRLNEELIKRLTGQDVMTARFLHAEFFEFKPAFKLFLACNHLPVIRGTDYAIWRRIRIIPFTVKIPEAEQNKELPAQLKEELPGILAWAVRGCQAWQQDGLQPPDEVMAATTTYRASMDVLGQFLEECCLVDTAIRVKATTLYDAYKRWCDANGERTMTQTAFGKRLEEAGFTGEKKSGVSWRLGLGLQDSAQDSF